MSFAIFTDGCSNLPGAQIEKYQIRVLPCTYTLDGVQHVYSGDIDSFDAPAHYNLLREGKLCLCTRCIAALGEALSEKLEAQKP